MNYSKSKEMPEVQTIDYVTYYRVTPVLINDMKKILGEIAYVDAKPLLDKLTANEGIMSAAQMNGFVRQLGNLPFKYVSGIMQLLNDSNTFVQYMKPIPKEELSKIDKKLLSIEENDNDAVNAFRQQIKNMSVDELKELKVSLTKEQGVADNASDVGCVSHDKN